MSAEDQINNNPPEDQQQAGGDQSKAGAAFGKLFVGQVPAVCTEEMLMPLFAPYGNIVEIKVMRDTAQRSKGCAWVRYENQAMAQAAIDALHEKHTIPPQVNTLQVRYAHSSREGGAGAGGAGGGGGGGQQQRREGGGQRRQGGGRNRGGGSGGDNNGQGGDVPPSYGVVQNNPYAMWQNPVGGGSFGSGNGSFGYQMNWPQYGGYGGNNNNQGGGGHRMQSSPPGTSVFIGNLPPNVDNESLRAFVSTHVNPQNITGVNIHRDRRFGFAQFDTAEAAHAAAQVLNSQEFNERKVRCEVTQNEAKKSQFRQQQQQQGGGQQMWQGGQQQQQGGGQY